MKINKIRTIELVGANHYWNLGSEDPGVPCYLIYTDEPFRGPDEILWYGFYWTKNQEHPWHANLALQGLTEVDVVAALLTGSS